MNVVGISDLFVAVGSLEGAEICYDLFAISNHFGTMDSGHYTADVKHFASQQWFNCNDHRYVTCSLLGTVYIRSCHMYSNFALLAHLQVELCTLTYDLTV